MSAITKNHKLSSLNNRSVFSNSSESQKSKNKAALILRIVKTNLSLASLLTSGGLLAFFGVSWLTDTFSSSLPPSPLSIFPVCVPFYKDTSHIEYGLP